MFSIKVTVTEQDPITQQTLTDISFTDTVTNVTEKECKLMTLADLEVATMTLQAGIRTLVVNSTQNISVSVNGTVVSSGQIHVLSDVIDITAVVITNLTSEQATVNFYGVND